MMKDWSGRKVLIIGAARQGIATAAYMVGHGAHVVLTDLRSAEDLRAEIRSLEAAPRAADQIQYEFGGHPLSLLAGVDLVCVSGGVPLSIPLVEAARTRLIPIANDSQLFLENAACRVVGITGCSGKSTTTMLLGQIARFAMGPTVSPNGKQTPKVWVGGNIGTPLISVLDQINQRDLAVMELSSFQLELMTLSPQIAAILNITPNHLDRHGSMENYTRIKGRILEYQEESDAAVLGRDNPTAWQMAQNVQSNLWTFGFHKQDLLHRGTYLAAEGIFLRTREKDQDLHVVHPGDIKLRGEHNLLNTLAACAIAAAAGLPVKAMREGIRSFEGIPHRLEFIRNWGGADWYNDSIATAPERTMAAIRSFDDPIILLAGGRNKDLPWDEFANLANKRVKHLIVFGEAAEVIIHAIKKNQQIPAQEPAASNRTFHQLPITKRDRMEDAVLAAAEIVQPGDVVLLSPGGTSFDQFKDFEERGECFAQLVKDLT